MIRLQPFRAVTPPEGSVLKREPSTEDVEEGTATTDSETLTAMLARWRAAGLLNSSEKPSLHLLEARVAGKQRTLLPDPPVRFLLGRLAADASIAPLEECAQTPPVPEMEPVISLVADPEGAFRGVLDEAAAHVVHVAEARADGHILRLGRITHGGSLRRIRAQLQHSPVRALTPPALSARQLAAFVSLAEPGLHLLPVHRGLRGWETYDEEKFLHLVGEYVRVFPLPLPLIDQAGIEDARARLASLSNGHHAILAVLSEGKGAILRVRQGIDLGHIPAVPRNPTLRSLDLALLEALVLRTVLGVKEPEAADHPNVLPVDSIETLVEQVSSGSLQVGFALNPPPVWEVRAVMEASARLPAHTLRVEPVPPRGFVLMDPEG